MADEEKVIFQSQPRLTGSAYRALKTTFYGHDYRTEIEKGRVQLWKVNGGELWIITRIEKTELVVCCAAGRGLVVACIYLLAAAKLQKLKTIRFHTYKPAFSRLIKKHFPFTEIQSRESGERVYRMRVN